MDKPSKPPENLGMEDRIRWYVNNDQHNKAYVLALLGDHLEANFEKTLVFLPEGTHPE